MYNFTRFPARVNLNPVLSKELVIYGENKEKKYIECDFVGGSIQDDFDIPPMSYNSNIKQNSTQDHVNLFQTMFSYFMDLKTAPTNIRQNPQPAPQYIGGEYVPRRFREQNITQRIQAVEAEVDLFVYKAINERNLSRKKSNEIVHETELLQSKTEYFKRTYQDLMSYERRAFIPTAHEQNLANLALKVAAYNEALTKLLEKSMQNQVVERIVERVVEKIPTASEVIPIEAARALSVVQELRAEIPEKVSPVLDEKAVSMNKDPKTNVPIEYPSVKNSMIEESAASVIMVSEKAKEPLPQMSLLSKSPKQYLTLPDDVSILLTGTFQTAEAKPETPLFHRPLVVCDDEPLEAKIYRASLSEMQSSSLRPQTAKQPITSYMSMEFSPLKPVVYKVSAAKSIDSELDSVGEMAHISMQASIRIPVKPKAPPKPMKPGMIAWDNEDSD